jgi:CheY-like chemotaxis protein
MMPEESGLDMLRELRNDPATKELPVVIYSAVSEHRYVKQAMDNGATDYWLKGSLRGPDLQTRLQAYLPDPTGWAEPWTSHPVA